MILYQASGKIIYHNNLKLLFKFNFSAPLVTRVIINLKVEYSSLERRIKFALGQTRVAEM